MTLAHRVALPLLVLLCALGGAMVLENIEQQHASDAAAYFAKSLRSIDVRFAASSSLSQLERIYARELARRSPLMDIEGTDPAALRTSIDQLEDTQSKLITAQKRAHDAQNLQSLYPIAYLRALAGLEDARERFIASGTEADREHYDAALRDAIVTGRRDLRSFETVFDAYARSNPGRFPTLGDTISTQRMVIVLGTIDRGFDAVASAQRERTACLSGDITRCDGSLLQITLPDAPASPANSATMSTVAAVRRMLAVTTQNDSYATNTMVGLSESACEGAYTNAPFYYLPPLSSPIRPTQFLNDLFFIPTQNNTAGFSVYMKQSLGMAYGRVNPSMYYICPDAGRDNALIAAVIETARFAEAHVAVASQLRRPLLATSTLYQSDATAYLKTALGETHDATTTDEIISLAHMFTNRGGNLESIVLEVTQIDARDIALSAGGVPIGISPKDLFLTHSAFPTFFQFYNPSFGTDGIGLRAHDPAASAALSLHVVPYSKLRTQISEAKILQDLRRFFALEQIN